MAVRTPYFLLVGLIAMATGCGDDAGDSLYGHDADAMLANSSTESESTSPNETPRFSPSDIDGIRGQTGRLLGRFRFTYYWVAAEGSGRKNRTLKDPRCRRLAKVSRSFSRRLIREGTGQLDDGRVVNVAGNCKCGRVCYFVTKEENKWGVGVLNRPLKPFRSVAVDPRYVKIGSWLYLADLDGLIMPGVAPWGGFVHDGCVVADDRGGGIKGRQLDLFSAKRGFWRLLLSRHGLSRVDVRQGGDRCGHHKLLENPGGKLAMTRRGAAI